jgi:hypothetical protein
LPNCLFAMGAEDALPTLAHDDENFGKPRAFELVFGTGDGEWCDPDCGVTSDTVLRQRMLLAGGIYRLSWYTKPREQHGTSVVAFLDPVSENGSLWHRGFANVETGPNSDWERLYRIVELEKSEEVLLTLYPSHEGPTYSMRGVVGGLMLEDISNEVGNRNLLNINLAQEPMPPGPYFETTDRMTRELPVCEDTTGEVFRNTRWRRECVRLCADGFASECRGSSAETYCYRETSFSINQRDIETGKILHSSGFARGNFNYRIQTIGVNFVGTGTRDCANSATPSTCYAGGFFSYSLEHGGPYMVRNHMGQDFRADLFKGRIENARGLASERYVTNPISSADRSLMEQYMRKEMRGRPLDGTFTLRVWEESGVNFDAVEDVQIVLDYRYWTRFD